MEEKECCMCCKEEKKTMRTDAQKKALLNRLKRIEGQIRGLQSMNGIFPFAQHSSINLSASSPSLI